MASTTNKRMSFVAVCAYDDKSQFHFFSPEFWIGGWADLERVGKATVEEQWAEPIGNQSPPKRSLWSRFRSGVAQFFRFRSAKTGEYVTKEYAEANPDTTVRERAS